MKKLFSLIMLSLLSIHTVGAVSFSDTNLSWYRHSIETLAQEGIISGYGDGRFWGDNTITRAEILKILFGAKGIQPPLHAESCFSDIKKDKWYHWYICEWVKLGVVKGFDDGTFKPDNPVTVLEALAMSLRIYGLTPSNMSTPWYLSYQEFANTNRILETSSYSITSPMTRGKASELILRVREYNNKKTPLTNLSQWCIAPQVLTSGTHEVTVAGKTRSYILTVPRSYTASNPAKLIIAIHGRTNSNTMVRWYMWLERQSDAIIAYPAWLPNGSAYSWSSTENIDFIDTIVRDVTESHCVSRSDIHIVAHSLGAWFASRLACTRGDTFRSMSIVGGGGYTSSCNDTPTATLIFQRGDDTLSSPATARATESKMKLINQCREKTETILIGGNSCTRSTDCSTGNPVIWCENYPTYGNDPHSWPTGGGSAILGWIGGL